MKRTALKRRRRPAAKIEAAIWRDGLGRCTICPAEGGCCNGPVQGHHAISRQALKKHGLNDYLLDRRNRVPVCEHRHEQHTSRYRPIPRGLLPGSVFEFAAEVGLEWYLDRFYPAEAAAA